MTEGREPGIAFPILDFGEVPGTEAICRKFLERDGTIVPETLEFCPESFQAASFLILVPHKTFSQHDSCRKVFGIPKLVYTGASARYRGNRGTRRKPAQRIAAVKTILVIEDDHDTRVSLRQNLEREGYVVHTAANGVQGWEILNRIGSPALILLDAVMPMMNGEEFLKKVAADSKLRAVPVVVMSAFPEVAKALAAKAFVQKPIDLKSLLEVVEKHCGPAPRA